VDLSWKPQVRYSSTMGFYKNTIYIYGGIGADLFSEIITFDVDKMKWNTSYLPQKGDVIY
jgi:hypothetical protein